MIDWNRLISNKERDYTEVLLLDCIYSGEVKSLSTNELYKKFKTLPMSKVTLIRKMKKLEALGLVNLIRTKPLFIEGVRCLQTNVLNLIRIRNKRTELVSKYYKMIYERVIW